ncbi:MAG: FadR family transcriptional regulator [Caldilineaceae bacterium]|nr:FadR family transcriptional regulator [Caldilineaceae bacterium]
MLRPLSRDTLTQQATDTLRRFILTEELKAGDQLPSERDLSESLSVSRNIVREALSVLVAQGLIEKKAGRGIFVREYDAATVAHQIAVSVDHGGSDLADLSEARAAVEWGAAHLMAERVTDEQLAQLEAINHSLADNLRNGRSVIKDDIEFHKVLLQATHNSVLINLIPLLVEHFRVTVRHQPTAIRRSEERVVAEHGRIIDALRTRDAAAVRAALAAHPLSMRARGA